MHGFRSILFSPLGLSCVLVAYLGLNTFVGVLPSSVRMDFSEDGLYTLSRDTHKILSAIDGPITLHFYFSEKLGREVPFYRTYAERVRELVKELQAESSGKILLQEHDPKPFSDEEDLAVTHGVQGIPVDQGGDLAYFGLAGINQEANTKVIAFFQAEREHLLEYDLVEIIHTLSNATATRLGVMSALPILGDVAGQLGGGAVVPWAIAGHLYSHFEVSGLPQSLDRMPNNLDVVMVVHPQQLNDRTQYQLEQFLFRGGRAIFFIDPKSESDYSGGPDLTSSSANSVDRLFKHWGISVAEGKLVADRSLALPVNAGTNAQPVPAEYLVWLNVTADQMAQNDPVTSQLSNLNLAAAGAIEIAVLSPLALQPLVTSSSNSTLISADRVKGLSPDILGLLNDFHADDQTYVMAGRFSAEVTTAFPEGAPQPVVPRENPEPLQLMQSEGPINIIVVADADLLEDRFWLRKQQFFGRQVEEQVARNVDFVINAISNLAGSDALLTLRSRGTSQRPFDRVTEIERRAEARLQEKEHALQTKLRETQQRIKAFEGGGSAQLTDAGAVKVAVTLTSEQRKQLEASRQEMLSIRKELRSVQAKLRVDVNNLEKRLLFFNIWLVPMIVAAIGSGLGFMRASRRSTVYAVSKSPVNKLKEALRKSSLT